MALSPGQQGLPTLCIARTSTAHTTRDTIRAAGGVADAMSIDLADNAGHAQQALLRWISNRPYRRMGVVLAAGELGPAGPLPESDLSAWAHTFAVNMLGNLAVLRALLGRKLEDAFGRIVFFGGGGAGCPYLLSRRTPAARRPWSEPWRTSMRT